MADLGEFHLIHPDDWLFQTHGDVSSARKRAIEWERQYGSLDGAPDIIEEFVRQWVLHRLITVYQYPRSWLGEKITIEEPIKMGSSEKQADITIKNDNRKPFLIIETKKRNSTPIDYKEAERQLESYLASTHTATIGMVTDGITTRSIRKKIDPNDFDYISDIPSFGSITSIKIKLSRDIIDIKSDKKTGLRPITEEYNRILVDCHNILRDVDGLHDDEALDELSKLIYMKIFDERKTIEKPVGAEFGFQVYGAANPSEAASNIRELYEEAKRKEIEVYSQRIPGYERSRGVFKAPIKLSDIALFKVTEKLQVFSFVDSKTDIKGTAFQKVLGSAIRAGMGQYFTPDPVVELAVGLIKPTASDVILDPFCGSGHFLSKCLDYVVSQQGHTLDNYALHQFKFFHLHGIEKSDRMVRIAMTDMMLHDDGHTNIRNLDSLLSFDNYPDIVSIAGDENQTPEVFDIIMTNPPFGSIMRQEVMNMIGRFELGNKKKSLPLEIIGLERCFQFLKPGGKLAIVLPDGLLKNKTSLFVRDWVLGKAKLKAIISLPEETFQPYGAMVKTSLCIFEKRKKNETLDSNDVFLCEVENIGFDATGRLKNGSEINTIISEFHKTVGWQ
ncbi:type I site-specific deoxyribonuclease LldI [Yersinia aldovae]|uniref:restriction endonuclease subunit M n=1 Tax=Yersinia aldovae TaxID=29483 RepID=UPI0005E01605|nr:N-6 DNA methylase [Yersinia aldovae]CNH85021.1 type I site-specific deoxyribonuclease LldI [Yersinia aldovae]